MDPITIAALAGAALLAALVQSAAGFGFAILAVPVFLMILGSLAAIQIAAVASLALSVMLVPGLWREAPRGLLVRLVAGSAAGFPLGMVLFRAADLASAKLAVGALVTVFALALMAREARGPAPEPDRGRVPEALPAVEVGVGFASGVMGAALAMPGPVVVLYLTARRAPKQISRAATLTLFGFSYATITALHAVWGGMTAQTWWLSAALLPAVLIGAVAGHVAARRLSEGRFRLCVLLVLLLSGVGAAATALT